MYVIAVRVRVFLFAIYTRFGGFGFFGDWIGLTVRLVAVDVDEWHMVDGFDQITFGNFDERWFAGRQRLGHRRIFQMDAVTVLL